MKTRVINGKTTNSLKKMLAVFVEVGEKETTFGKRNISQLLSLVLVDNSTIIKNCKIIKHFIFSKDLKHNFIYAKCWSAHQTLHEHVFDREVLIQF